MRLQILLFFVILGMLNLNGQDSNSVYNEMLILREKSIGQIRDYLTYRVDSQINYLKTRVYKGINYKDVLIIDGVPINIDYLDSASVKNYKTTIDESVFKEICISKYLQDFHGPEWANLIIISTTRTSDLVYETKKGKTKIFIPAFASASFEKRDLNTGRLVESILERLPFHADITIRDVEKIALEDDEMLVTLINRENRYTIGFYLK